MQVYLRILFVQNGTNIGRGIFIAVKWPIQQGFCTQNIYIFIVHFWKPIMKSFHTGNQCLFGTTEDHRQLFIFKHLCQFLTHNLYNFFRRLLIVINKLPFKSLRLYFFEHFLFLLLRQTNVKITKITNTKLPDINSKLRIDKWSNFGVESPQATWSIIFTTFSQLSLPQQIVGAADYEDIRLFILTYQQIQSWIIIY